MLQSILLCMLLANPPDGVSPDFSREIRPLLVRHCYACHGPDEAARQAELRLDRPDTWQAELPSGARVVTPGEPEASELLRRVTHPRAAKRMPPPRTGSALASAEIEILRRWIAAGAPWNEHWAYVPPSRPEIPTTPPGWTIHNPIDSFVWARLDAEGLAPSPPADPHRLLRRAALAITGLPPSAEELERFVADPDDEAYVAAVESMFASPRFGEHQAVAWLDAARYADTHGYHIDSRRDMWRWRDWVIESYNRNQPFDEFTREQLAGDLLANPTLEQRLATGFLRNHMINFEEGAIAEEYRHHYVADRVATVASVWLGQTLRCAQCHDHKHDPWTQRDYYRFYALFNRVPERGLDGRVGNAAPLLRVPTAEQRREAEQRERRMSEFRAALAVREADAKAQREAWEPKLRAARRERPEAPGDVAARLVAAEMETGEAELRETVTGTTVKPRGPVGFVPARDGWALLCNGEVSAEIELPKSLDFGVGWTLSGWVFPTTRDPLGIAELEFHKTSTRYALQLVAGRPQVLVIAPHEERKPLRLVSEFALAERRWRQLTLVGGDDPSIPGQLQLFVDGRPLSLHAAPLEPADPESVSRAEKDSPATLSETLRAAEPEGKSGTGPKENSEPMPRAAVGLRIGRASGVGFRGMLGEFRLYARAVSEREAAGLAEIDPLGELLAVAAEERTAEQQDALVRHYLEIYDDAYRRESAALAEELRAQARAAREVPTAMVMEEGPPRPTFVLAGGDYRRAREQVVAGLPNWLGGPVEPNAEGMIDRTSLANWIASPNNPLTARVEVNRIWQHYFGTGLVATADDFGIRGAMPSHPELLDWLACEFVESGWNRKHIHRLIVCSAVYRQSSRVTAELAEQDPRNRRLARGPAFRLPAEAVRDGVLHAGGLLREQLGGPSVFPFQPPGLWREVSVSPEDYTAQVYVPGPPEQWYRRAVYTFWKRTSPPPALAAFDAPNREICRLTRERGNTPQQALVLWNEPVFVEAAVGVALHMLRSAATDDARLAAGFRRVLGRSPRERELEILQRLLAEERSAYRARPKDAAALVRMGASPLPAGVEETELAAFTNLATTLFSLDEFLCPK